MIIEIFFFVAQRRPKFWTPLLFLCQLDCREDATPDRVLLVTAIMATTLVVALIRIEHI
jgi:hypothetical protein